MAWIHNDLNQKANAGAYPAAQGAIDSYVTPWNGQQHVNYFDAQGQIHELFYDGSNWHHTPLSQQATDLPGATPRLPADASAIVGYSSLWNQQQQIKYVDTAGHINELYFDGGWHHTNFIDLFERTAIRTLGWPARQGMIAAYATEWSEQQHVFYFGGEPVPSVHELYYDGHWHGNNLASPSLYEGLFWGMHGYTTPWNQQQHVVAITTSGVLYELHYTDHWDWKELGLDKPLPNLQHNRAIHGHVTLWNAQQHVIYIDRINHIEELLYVDGAANWIANDLTTLATKTNGGVPVGVAGSPGGGTNRDVNGYITLWNQQQHINYIDSLGFVNELLYNGSDWSHNSLTTLAPGAEDPKFLPRGTAIAGHATEWNKQQHVFYVDVSGHINELVYMD